MEVCCNSFELHSTAFYTPQQVHTNGYVFGLHGTASYTPLRLHMIAPFTMLFLFCSFLKKFLLDKSASLESFMQGGFPGTFNNIVMRKLGYMRKYVV